MTYADFESILIPEKNGKKIPGKPFMNKYQNHVSCGYVYKLVCVDD